MKPSLSVLNYPDEPDMGLMISLFPLCLNKGYHQDFHSWTISSIFTLLHTHASLRLALAHAILKKIRLVCQGMTGTLQSDLLGTIMGIPINDFQNRLFVFPDLSHTSPSVHWVGGGKGKRMILHPFMLIWKLSTPFPVCHNVVFVTSVCVEVHADTKNRSKLSWPISVSLQSLIMVSETARRESLLMLCAEKGQQCALLASGATPSPYNYYI